jgi:hypothetical protein
MALRSLLQQSRALTNAQLSAPPVESDAQLKADMMDVTPVSGADVLPRVDRPLDQLEAQTRKLWQKAARTRDAMGDSRAYV